MRRGCRTWCTLWRIAGVSQGGRLLRKSVELLAQAPDLTCKIDWHSGHLTVYGALEATEPVIKINELLDRRSRPISDHPRHREPHRRHADRDADADWDNAFDKLHHVVRPFPQCNSERLVWARQACPSALYPLTLTLSRRERGKGRMARGFLVCALVLTAAWGPMTATAFQTAGRGWPPTPLQGRIPPRTRLRRSIGGALCL